MRTLLLSPALFAHEGGIERIMRLYLKALCELAGPNDRVDSLVLNDPPGRDARLDRYANDRVGESIGCDRRKGRFIREAIRLGRRADHLVCAHLHHLPLAWLARRFNSRLRYYLVAHGIEAWRPYSRMERRALLGAERILCVSEYTRRQMLRFCPELSPARLLVVPNTLDPYFVASPATAPAFAGPRILCVTRLTADDSYKGVDTLIEVLPQLRRDFPFAQLRIVGQGDDLLRLTGLADRLGMRSSVEFLGPVTDEALRTEYATCDFFALPSRREGFGLVYLEAMTYGKACLVARAGGAPEVVTPDVGVLIDYGNLTDLGAGLTDLARHPRDPEVVRRHAASFAFPVFQGRLATALS